MNEFYVYLHKRRDTDEVFYVGKGKKSRAYCRVKRNKYWINIVNKYDYYVEFFKTNLTEEDAYGLEAVLVDRYQAQGLCRANIRLGGGSVASFTEEFKAEQSRKMREYYRTHTVWNKGASGIYTEEQRERIACTLRESYAAGKYQHWRKTNKKYYPSGMKGKKHRRESIIKKVESQDCREFYAFDSTGTLVWQGLLQTDCAAVLGFSKASRKHICDCLKGRRPHVQGFVFLYLDDLDKLDVRLKQLPIYRPFEALKIETGEVVWVGTSQSECARVLSLNKANICSCFKGRRSSCAGYTFRYIDQPQTEAA